MRKIGVMVFCTGLLLGLGWWVWSFLAPVSVEQAERTSEPAGARDAVVVHEALSVPAPSVRRELGFSEGNGAQPGPSRSGANLQVLVRGRLVSSGDTVAGMKVELLALEALVQASTWEERLTSLSREGELLRGEADSGGDGVFEFEVMPAPGVHVLGVDLGGARATSRWLGQVLEPGTVVELGDIELPVGRRLRGRVENAEGRGLEGARVRISSFPLWAWTRELPQFGEGDLLWVERGLGGRPQVFSIPAELRAWERRLPLATVLTGPGGAFEFAQAPEEEICLLVDHQGVAGTVFGPFAEDESDLGRLSLQRGLPMDGVVVDTKGKAIAGANVAAGSGLSQFGLGVLRRAEDSGDDGSFELAAVQGKAPFWVAVRRDEASMWQVQGPFAQRDGLRLVLPSRHRLRVKAVGPEGQALRGAVLSLRRRGSQEQAWVRQIEGWAGSAVSFVELGDGVYEARGIAQGDYELIGRAGDWRAQTLALSVDEDREEELRFRQGRFVRIRVIDGAGGGPVSDARVRVGSGWDGGGGGVEARSDVSGEARVGPLLFGDPLVGGNNELWIQVDHPQYARRQTRLEATKLPPGDDFWVVDLGRGGEVQGVVSRNGAPESVPVWISLRRASSSEPLPWLALSDQEGRFRFSRLRAGRYRWRVYPQGGEPDALSSLDTGPLARSLFPASMPDGALREGQLSVREGRVSRFEIELDQDLEATASIEVLAQDSGRRAVALRLQMEGPTPVGLSLISGEWGGRRRLLPGRYTARILLPDRVGGTRGVALYKESFELAAHQRKVLRVPVELFEMRLLVVDQGGRRVSGAQCRIARGKKVRVAESGPGGEVRVVLPARMGWTLSVEHSRAGVATLKLNAAPGVTRVALHPGVPCEGRVLLGEGPLGSNLELTLVATEGGVRRSTRVSRDALRFRFVGVAAGDYEASFYDRDSGRRLRGTFTLPANGSRRLQLDFRELPER